MTTHGHNTMGLLQHANTSTSVADGIYETVCSTVQLTTTTNLFFSVYKMYKYVMYT